MASSSLEKRVEILETQVEKLKDEVRSVQERKKDWRRTIGAFTGDDGLQQILRDAMRLREADRKQARSKRTAKRKTQR